MREFAEETVKTGIKAARHVFRYLSYHMSAEPLASGARTPGLAANRRAPSAARL